MSDNVTQSPPSNLISVDRWLKDLGKTRVTGYRWRRDGLVSTINIYGRHYITRDEIARFEARAMAGEFTKAHAKPTREKASV